MNEDYFDDEEEEMWDDDDDDDEIMPVAENASGAMYTMEEAKLRAREFLGGGIREPVIHPINADGFFLWRTVGSQIWHLQCIGIQSRFGRVILEKDVAGISRTTFEVPIENEVDKLMQKSGFGEFTTETFNSYYLNDAWFIAKLIESEFAKTVKQVPDSVIDDFVPKRTYYAAFSKIAGKIYHPDVKTVQVKLKVLETGEIAEGEVPIDLVREMNLPEWSE